MNRNRIILFSAIIISTLALSGFLELNKIKNNLTNNPVLSNKNKSSEKPATSTENSPSRIDTTTTTADGFTEKTLAVGDDNWKDFYRFKLGPNETNLIQDLKVIELPKNLFKNLTWHLPEKLPSSYDVLVTKAEAWSDGMFGPSISYDSTTYEIGFFNYDSRDGRVLLINDYFFVSFEDKITWLKGENKAGMSDLDAFDKNAFYVENNLLLPPISYPEKIVLSKYEHLELINPTKSYFLKLKIDSKLPPCEKSNYVNCNSLLVADNISEVGKIFYEKNRVRPFIILPNGLVVEYEMKMDQAKIVANANEVGKGQFKFMKSGRCGGETEGLECIEELNISDLNILKKDGQNSVYGIKDINDQWYSNFLSWHYLYDANGEFISPTSTSPVKAVLFWVDPFGRVLKMQNTNVQSMAECGKPVIYLYPTKESTINVRINPNGGLTKVTPDYPLNGWTVQAKPNGELTNLADQQKYPYLFWEGNALGLNIPQEGFIIKKAEVESKMKKLLTKLGLNEKETADFLEFWQIKLEEKPYVFVTFVSQTDFDKVAPLNISPSPDKVIRVFMDYQPLDRPISVRPLKFQTPVRTGFTVVEWGGRLHQ